MENSMSLAIALPPPSPKGVARTLLSHIYLHSSSNTRSPLPCCKPTPKHAVLPAAALALSDAFLHSALCFGWLLRPSISPAFPWASLAVSVLSLRSALSPWQCSDALGSVLGRREVTRGNAGAGCAAVLAAPVLCSPWQRGPSQLWQQLHPLAKAPAGAGTTRAVSRSSGCGAGAPFVPSAALVPLRWVAGVPLSKACSRKHVVNGSN